MPKMSGNLMLEEIFKMNPNQKVVIMTAHDEDKYLTKFSNLQVKHVLQKPLNYESLLHTLKELVK